jgi:hypothetical protein
MTTWLLALRTFAVAVILIVTGAGPHEKVITPPAATADTTACDVQLAAVPLPTTCVGCEVFTGLPSAGTLAWPFGLPACGSVAGAFFGGGFFVVVVGGVVVVGAGEDMVAGAPIDGDADDVPIGIATAWPEVWAPLPHADRVRPDTTTATTTAANRFRTERNASPSNGVLAAVSAAQALTPQWK